MNTTIFKNSLDDIRLSLDECLHCSIYVRDQLKRWKAEFSMMQFLQDEIVNWSNELYGRIEQSNLDIIDMLHILASDVASYYEDVEELQIVDLIKRRDDAYMRIRVLMSHFSALLTSMNWQSPSIKSSKNARIGVERMPVVSDYNDYKRDRSGDTIYGEEIIRKRIFKTKKTYLKPMLNLTNCGMASFTSILYFLLGEDIVKRSIMAPSQIYVENMIILKQFFKNKIDILYESDADSIIDTIKKRRPNAVFFDVISNTYEMRVFDIKTIITKIAATYTDEIYFIIDATCNIGYENIIDTLDIPKNVKIIIHGSLLKGPQLGMDRAYVGFVLSFGLDGFKNKILEYRTLSGTTLQDNAAYSIPITSRALLRRRLTIAQRNNMFLANFFENLARDNLFYKGIVYPGIKSHKDYIVAKRLGFLGPFFNVRLIEKYNNDVYFEKYTTEIIKFAKLSNVNIVHGASYGFNQTSIYYSVGWERPQDHYLRISAGIETEYEMKRMIDVFSKAHNSFKSLLDL